MTHLRAASFTCMGYLPCSKCLGPLVHCFTPAPVAVHFRVDPACCPLLFQLHFCWLLPIGAAHPVGLPEREERHLLPLSHLCGQSERRCGRPCLAASVPAHRRVLRCAGDVGPQHRPLQGLWLCLFQVGNPKCFARLPMVPCMFLLSTSAAIVRWAHSCPQPCPCIQLPFCRDVWLALLVPTRPS